MKICFTILHFKTYMDTIKCVNSIISIAEIKDIVIVDNASNDGSFEKVKKEFKYQNNIYFIHNERNLGFASGNNVGYRFAKKRLNDNVIIICNNDVVFDDKNFLLKLEKNFKETNFDVAGPDIVVAQTNEHQNPLINKSVSKHKISKKIIQYRILLLLSKFNLYEFIRSKIHLSKEPIISDDLWKKRRKNIPLHGSVLIFGPNFVKKEEYAFRPGTFLYLEENILFSYCQQNNYKTFYLPDLEVLHKEDSATDELVGNRKAKREFIFKNMIRSLKVYKRYLIQENRNL